MLGFFAFRSPHRLRGGEVDDESIGHRLKVLVRNSQAGETAARRTTSTGVNDAMTASLLGRNVSARAGGRNSKGYQESVSTASLQTVIIWIA